MAQAWHCPRCDTVVEGDFDVCWQCGSDRDGHIPSDFVTYESEDREIRRKMREPTPAWTRLAMTVACLSLIAAGALAIIYWVCVDPPPDLGIPPHPRTAILFLILTAASLCVWLGSFAAFCMLWFYPLQGAPGTPWPDEAPK